MRAMPATLAWIRHKLHECERCWRWSCALADATLCSTGEKLYRQLVKECS